MSLLNRVHGRCPMGCGQTLALGAGGHIVCTWADCARPSAVDEILADGETEHVVRIGETDWSSKHPLRERLDDQLIDCELGAYLSDAPGPPVDPGVYRVHRDELGQWHYVPVTS